MTRKFFQRKSFYLLVLPFSLLSFQPVWANDTTELWDYRAIDFEFYLSRSHITSPLEKASFTTTIMLGYGLHPKFSFYLGSNINANGFLGESNLGVFGGIFTTPIDTKNFDLDLFFQVEADDDIGLRISPFAEFNLDFFNHTFGIYARSGLQFGGLTGKKLILVDLLAHLGSYVTIARDHQILLELRMNFHLNGDREHYSFEAIALGYNVYLNSEIELISELFLILPPAGDQLDFGITFGFIATFNKK